MATTDDAGTHECPTCGRSDFASGQGMKQHHAKTHGESIAGREVECQECGEPFRVISCRQKSAKYCSLECRNRSYTVDRLSKTCQVCGGGFGVRPSRADAKVCSTPCRNELVSEMKSQKVSLKCGRCGGSFEAPSSIAPRRRFCSVECKSGWQQEAFSGENSPTWEGGKEEFECEWCGGEYKKYPSLSQRTRFCSFECMHEWRSEALSGEGHPMWNGGEYAYGPGFNEKTKEQVRESQNHSCDGCGFHNLSHLERYGLALHIHHKTKARRFDDPGAGNGLGNLAALCCPCHAKAERMAPLYPFAD